MLKECKTKECQKTCNKKRRRPRKRWTGEVEEHLNTTGIRNIQALVRDPSCMEEHVLEAKVLNGLCHLRISGTGMNCFKIRRKLTHGHDILVDNI
jgi:hypothetical protein